MSKLDRYDVWASSDMAWPCLKREKRDSGQWCESDDVAKLEAEHAAVCAHMMRMFYALVNFTNPQPDDDAAEVMAEAKQAVELYLNDSSMVVTVELPDDENEVTL